MRPPNQQTRPSLRPARAADLDAMHALLAEHGLPLGGLAEHLGTALVATEGDRVVGTAALEVYPDGALLRSVSVAETHRGTGLGRRLSEAAMAMAREQALGHVYLLTTTAPDFFAHLGFARVTRAEVAPGVRSSAEFTTLCPDSAIVMARTL